MPLQAGKWERTHGYSDRRSHYFRLQPGEISSSASLSEINRGNRLHLAEGTCKDSAFFRQAYNKCYGKMPRTALEVSSWEVIASLTVEGLGIGYFPDYIALGKSEALKQYKINLPSFPYSIKAFFTKGMKLRKSSEAFLSFFQM